MSATHRIQWFEYGGFGEVAGIFGVCYGFGAMAGIALPASRNLQWEALGTFGYHHYESGSMGALRISGDTAFAGARFGARYAFGQSRSRFFLGLWGVAESDLTRETRSYMDQDWFSDEQTERKGTLGAVNVGLVLRVGGVFDR